MHAYRDGGQIQGRQGPASRYHNGPIVKCYLYIEIDKKRKIREQNNNLVMRRLVQQETVHLLGFILRKESITGLYMIMIDEITIFLINKRSVSTIIIN